jgi:drug/metabolite transporter (DMT)-like permease
MSIILAMMGVTLIGAIAAACLKKASATNEQNLFKLLFSKMFILGIFLYGIGAIMNILLLSLYDYSIVFPLTTLTYAWSVILGFAVYKERVSVLKIISVLLIILGAVLIVRF